MQNRRSLPPLEDDFTRALLRSADVDEPSRAAYAKVAAALGVGTALGVGASLPAPAAVVAGASVVSGASALARWSGTLAGKLTLLGVSGALLLGAGAAFLHHGGASASGSAPVLAAQPEVTHVSALVAAEPAVAVSPQTSVAPLQASAGSVAPRSSV